MTRKKVFRTRNNVNFVPRAVCLDGGRLPKMALALAGGFYNLIGHQSIIYHLNVDVKKFPLCKLSAIRSYIALVKVGKDVIYRKPPNISPGLIFVRKHFLVGLYMGRLIYGGAYIRTRFCVNNINHLLTLFLYNTRLIYKEANVYIRVGLYSEW